MRHTALELGNGTNILTLLAAKADASSVYTKTQVDGLIAGVAEGSTAAKVVNTIAERDALDPKRGFVWVVDATGDSTVVTGGAMYLYNEATSSWIKTAEAESMDLIVKWDDIQGKPEDITRAGNTFNTAGNLVKLGVDGKYPGIDGSLITNLSSANLNGQIGIGLIPISTNIATDAASDTKVATPKAVKTYVDDNTHTHSNKSTLDKIGEADGKMTFDGEEIGGSIDLSNYSAETIKLTGTKKIQIAGGSATSGILDITTGDDGRPALTTPGLWSADIAGYLTTIHGGMQMDIYADSSQADIRIIAGANNNSTGSAGGHILLYGADIKYNDASLNAANGLVKLGSDGKIPTNLYDAGTEIDLSNYTTTSAISMKSNGLNTGITFGTVNGEIQIYYGTLTNGLIINGSTANLRHTAAVNIIGNSSTSVGSFSGGTTTIVASNLTNLKLQIGSTSAGANTAGGFAVVESSGKLPASIIPASTIDLSNYSNDTISLTASGVFHIRGNTLNIGTASTSEIQIGNNNSTTYLNASAEDTLYLRIGNTTAYLNAPGGLARVGLDGKLPSEIVPSNDTGYTKETIDQSKFATEDSTRGTKYFEIDGLCDVLLADADGTLIGVEVQFMFATTKTRVHIPASLAAGSIASWTLLTKKITVAS